MRRIGTVTGRLSSGKPNMQNPPRAPMHGFKTGDRVEVTVYEGKEVRRRGIVTYARKLRRIGVKFDHNGETAQVRVQQVRKLDELEILGEALEGKDD